METLFVENLLRRFSAIPDAEGEPGSRGYKSEAQHWLPDNAMRSRDDMFKFLHKLPTVMPDRERAGELHGQCACDEGKFCAHASERNFWRRSGRRVQLLQPGVMDG